MFRRGIGALAMLIVVLFVDLAKVDAHREDPSATSSWGRTLRPAGWESIPLTPEERAWLADHPSLRIGVDPAWPPYEMVDASGRYSGIGADYVELIRDRLGVAMDVEPGLTWEEVLTKLEAREIDLSPAITRTPERSRYLLFTQPHIKYSVAIVTRLEHAGVEGLTALAGKRVALVKGYAFTEITLASQPGIVPVAVGTVLGGLNTVSNGEAEAIVSDLPSLSYKISEYHFLNLKVAGIAPFQTEGLRIGVRNDWPILVSILDKVLDSITPEEHQEIRRRWVTVPSRDRHALDLTPEEREWLARHPVIRNAADPRWAPVEYMDERGRLRGFTSEYLSRMEEMLQVRFETPGEMSWAQMMEALKEGRLDMASCVRDTPQRRTFLDFTEPYFSMPTAIFTQTDIAYADLNGLRGKRVAVVEGYALQDLIAEAYPDIQLIPVPHIEEGLTLLSRGEVFAYVDALAPGTYGIGLHGFEDIHVAGETPFRYEMAMAASKHQPLLVSILQKAIRAIPDEDRERFFQRWATVPIAYRTDYSNLWRVFAGASALLILFVYWNRRLAREVSGRRRVEADLRQAKEDLELRVAERTAELASRNAALAEEVLERRRAEEALRESETSFTQLFQSAPVPMAFATDFDGYRSTTWNEAWYRTFGYPREMAEGRSGADIGLWVHPEDRARFIETAERESDVAAFETLLRRYDGAVRHCSLFGRFIDRTGMRLLMVVYLDITERKQAEAALRESEERFSKAFALSPAPMVLSEIESGRFIDANEQWLRMLEHSREETIGHTSYELGIWEDPDIRGRLGGKLMEEGSFQDEPIRFITKSGTIKDALWSAEKIVLGGKEVMLSVIYDFSERKRAEEALRAKTEELDRFFSVALDLLCIADTDGHFRRLNPQWETVLGYPLSELEGKRFLDFVHPEDREATLSSMSRLADQKSLLGFTNRYQCRDGSYRWIEWRSYPAGNLIYAAARDITDQKQAEEALRASLLEKESLLKEVHHRVKNNLQVISSLLKLQSRKIQNPALVGILRDTQNRVRSMALLHETLYRSGNLARVSFPQYVKQVCGYVANSYSVGSQQVRMVYDVDDVTLDLDVAIPTGLIISELVSNAFKHAFADRTNGEILVALRESPSHKLTLRVEDNGIGIPSGGIAQAGETLGLLLVRNLTQQLDGSLSIRSGSGTVFEIEFPVQSR